MSETDLGKAGHDGKHGGLASHTDRGAVAPDAEVSGHGVHQRGLAMDPGHRALVEKSLKRKLDTRCSLFVLIYIMNYLDRNNIAAARLKGLQDDLKMDYPQYATCLSILYVGYILMQVRASTEATAFSYPDNVYALGPQQHLHQPHRASEPVHCRRHAAVGAGVDALRDRAQLWGHGRRALLPRIRGGGLLTESDPFCVFLSCLSSRYTNTYIGGRCSSSQSGTRGEN